MVDMGFSWLFPQARDYYRLSTCSCCEHVAPWSFLQSLGDAQSFRRRAAPRLESFGGVEFLVDIWIIYG